LVEAGDGVLGVEADDERRDTERSNTTGLGVSLLNTGDVFRNILDGDGVFDGQSMTLSFEARLVDQNPGIGVEAGEGETDVGINKTDLGGRNPSVLKLQSRSLLTSEDNNILSLDAYCAGT
jgi:hypothetical protein